MSFLSLEDEVGWWKNISNHFFAWTARGEKTTWHCATHNVSQFYSQQSLTSSNTTYCYLILSLYIRSLGSLCSLKIPGLGCVFSLKLVQRYESRQTFLNFRFGLTKLTAPAWKTLQISIKWLYMNTLGSHLQMQKLRVVTNILRFN